MSPEDREFECEAVYRMELRKPPRSAKETATREVYGRLIAFIGQLELDEPDPGWEERAVERWRRERQR